MKTKHAVLFLAFITVSATSLYGLKRYSDYRKAQQQQELLRQQELQNPYVQARIRGQQYQLDQLKIITEQRRKARQKAGKGPEIW
jgi:hypothetical protein